jgi:hypothetical protein
VRRMGGQCAAGEQTASGTRVPHLCARTMETPFGNERLLLELRSFHRAARPLALSPSHPDVEGVTRELVQGCFYVRLRCATREGYEVQDWRFMGKSW